MAIGPPIDIELGERFDLLDAALQGRLVSLVRRRRVWAVHMGPVCTGWSTARDPRFPAPTGKIDFARF
eukprot:2704489-Lingulodinium_polyedra.AAC.1